MKMYHIDSGVRIKKYEKTTIDGEEVFKETEEWRDFKRKKKTEALLQVSGIPFHALELSLDDYVGKDLEKIEKMKIYLKNFDSKFKHIHLYFWSVENSTQKTTMASVLGKDLLTAGFKVQFVLMSRLIKLLSEEKFEPEHEKILNPIRNADFLIIDDSFDKKKATIYKSGFQIPFLDEFLRTRLEIEKKATCFTSNIPIDSIDEDVFGTSMKKLLKRSIPDPFHFKSSYELRNDFKPDDLWS
ncbi:MAG: hypothetical protein EOM07_11300 [Clostridia bacterium]|nr:hypothetical protein [Clostridia bacterium]